MISEGLMEKLSVTGLCDDSRRVKPGNSSPFRRMAMKLLPAVRLQLVLLLLWARRWLRKDLRPSGFRSRT